MTVDTKKETLEFQTEVRQLLRLMIHSLYSNKEIFLRELISNASDACDKLRFEALQNAASTATTATCGCGISIDKEKRTITVSDNGVGMIARGSHRQHRYHRQVRHPAFFRIPDRRPDPGHGADRPVRRRFLFRVHRRRQGHADTRKAGAECRRGRAVGIRRLRVTTQ